MLTFTSNPRIFLYQDKMDMRKGFESLSAIVERSYSVEITSGAYFIFLSKKQDRMKIIYWDNDGLAIWYKRLEKGKFIRVNHKKNTLSRSDFFMLLEGITPKKINNRYRN